VRQGPISGNGAPQPSTQRAHGHFLCGYLAKYHQCFEDKASFVETYKNVYLCNEISEEMGHKYVCLHCRKSYSVGTGFIHFQEKKICPECLAPMTLLNEKFKAPRKDDTTQWEIVKLLVDNGFFYQSVLDPISGEKVPYPRTKRDAEAFIEKYKK
jgi:hypothetical protein